MSTITNAQYDKTKTDKLEMIMSKINLECSALYHFY
jgi:hypothetical protein